MHPLSYDKKYFSAVNQFLPRWLSLKFGAPWTPLSALYTKKWPRVRNSRWQRKSLIIIRNALYDEY